MVGQKIPYLTKWPRVKSKSQVLGHLMELKKKPGWAKSGPEFKAGGRDLGCRV